MIGRFLLGMVSGGVLVTGGLVVGAILSPMRATEVTSIAEVEAPPAVELAEDATAETVTEPAPEPEAEPEASPEPAPEPETVVEETAEQPTAEAAEAPAPDADALAEVAVSDVASDVAIEQVPEAAAEPSTEVAADAGEAGAGAGEAVAEATPEATAALTQAPETTEAPEAVADPIAEIATEVATEVAAEPPAEPPAVVEGAEPVPTETVTPEPVLPEPETVAEPEPAPEAEPAAEPAPEPLPETAPEIATEVPAADPPLMPGSRSKPLPGADEPATPDVAAEAESDTAPPASSTLEPTPGLDAAPEGVVIGRLPKIGDQPEGAVEVAEEAPDAATDAQPILAYAAPFENLDAKPVLAVVLIDNGAADLDRAALAALPFPVSFALDPLDPATPERAAIYRAAGREVVILATGIAYGAQASDVEVAFQSMAQNLPEAVAVMDLATPMFQNQRPLASIVVPVVATQGRGLLTWDQGLNAADQVARREDVPAAVIFRDLASSGTDTLAIRRILDRAVFKAGQDGRAVVAGDTTPETIAALLEWSVEGRAASVALGPLTAAMQVD